MQDATCWMVAGELVDLSQGLIIREDHFGPGGIEDGEELAQHDLQFTAFMS